MVTPFCETRCWSLSWFSHGTMPLRNIFKNSDFLYEVTSLSFVTIRCLPCVRPISSWLFGHESLHQGYSEGRRLWIFTRLCLNSSTSLLTSHCEIYVLLAQINALFHRESVSRSFLAHIMTRTLRSLINRIASPIPLSLVWALRKHRNYKKEFGKAECPRNRKAMFPFIV